MWRRHCLPAVIACAAFGVNVAQCAEPTVIVHCGLLLSVPGQAPQERRTLVIREARIESIHEGYLDASALGVGAPVELIDLSRQFVLPGLIDLHVHLTSETEPGEALRVVTRDAADLALAARYHARETVEAGFTTVLDLGTARPQHAEALRALKSAVARNLAIGPRILTVGSPISTPGMSRTGRFGPDIDAVVGPDGVCSGPQDCAREVREQVAGGADVISFYSSGSLGDVQMVEQAMTDDEMRAVVRTAHALGRKVVADGHTAAAVNAALRARADIIDTAPWADEQSFALMKSQGAFFEPHLYAFVVSVQDLRSGSVSVPDSVDSPIVARLQGVLAKPFAAQFAHERGVQLVYGSDTGIVRHGDNAGELLQLVKIGLTPMQAIEVATSNSATALGLAGEVGSIEAGKRADLIATDRNPLADIAALRQVTLVMRDGHVLKHH
jgi:imidazolonepropionase-like amidohydrolase